MHCISYYFLWEAYIPWNMNWSTPSARLIMICLLYFILQIPGLECTCFDPKINIKQNLWLAATRHHSQCVKKLIIRLKNMEGSFDFKRGLITDVMWNTLQHGGNNVVGRNETVDILLEAGANVHLLVYKHMIVGTSRRPTLLMDKCKTGDIWLVEKLVGWLADLEKTDENGQTALFYAAAGIKSTFLPYGPWAVLTQG